MTDAAAPTPLVIVGAGGAGRELHDLLLAVNDAAASPPFAFLGFFADGQPAADLLEVRGAAHLGDVAALQTLGPEVRYVIGIGSGAARRRIDAFASACGLEPATLVHPMTANGRFLVDLGPGTVVNAFSGATSSVRFGRHVLVSGNDTIGHDCVIGDYVTFSPGVHLSGNVVVEDGVTLGTGAVVLPGVRIGQDAVVGAGAAVVRDVAPGTTVVGVPARPVGAG